MKKDTSCDTVFPKDNIYGKQCPVIYAPDIVGQKWRLPIMWYLSEKEPVRYNELKEEF